MTWALRGRPVASPSSPTKQPTPARVPPVHAAVVDLDHDVGRAGEEAEQLGRRLALLDDVRPGGNHSTSKWSAATPSIDDAVGEQLERMSELGAGR